MSRRAALLLVAAAAVVPRLVVLLYERGGILADFAEKSDLFADTFVESGTYGFIPDVPSAYTQPLYGFFLVPVYAVFGREWLAVGLAQIAVAVAVALLVYELGRRWISPRAGLLAALGTTLNPYLVWHDVHVNREIVDQLVAVALVLATLALAERPTWKLGAATGFLCGLAVLGNTRLAALPLVLLAYVAWRNGWALRRLAVPAAAVVVAAAVAVVPWVARNKVNVGCFAVTTDAKALWKANNPRTDDILEAGLWIDAVPDPPGAPLTPHMAGEVWRRNGQLVRVDECEQMRDYQQLVFDFWREHPGEKAELAARGSVMLWDPRVTNPEGNPGKGTWLDTVRGVVLPVYTVALYALGALGLRYVPRAFAALALAVLAYQWLAAIVFVGATRYRVPWDFLIALLAAAAVARLAERRR